MSEASIQLRSGWSFPDHALDAIRAGLVRQLPRHEHLVVRGGWSLGGLLALYEVAGGQSPATHLILISSTARFCTDDAGWPGTPVANFRALQRQFERSPPDALAGFHRWCAGPSATESLITQRVAESLAMGLDALRTGLQALATLDARAALQTCPIPVLLLHGTLDPVIPMPAAERMVEVLPVATLVRHPQAGHDLPLQYPEWVLEQTAHFLSSPA